MLDRTRRLVATRYRFRPRNRAPRGVAWRISSSTAAYTACASSGWQLTNLELQKLLYIAHMTYLGRHGRPLVAETFEAWDYGPVLPSLYRTVKVFGGGRITDIRSPGPIAETPEVRMIREVVTRFAGVSPGALVQMTHRENGAWANNYRPGKMHIPLPNDEILAEYRRFNQ